MLGRHVKPDFFSLPAEVRNRTHDLCEQLVIQQCRTCVRTWRGNHLLRYIWPWSSCVWTASDFRTNKCHAQRQCPICNNGQPGPQVSCYAATDEEALSEWPYVWTNRASLRPSPREAVGTSKRPPQSLESCQTRFRCEVWPCDLSTGGLPSVNAAVLLPLTVVSKQI